MTQWETLASWYEANIWLQLVLGAVFGSAAYHAWSWWRIRRRQSQRKESR